MSTLIDCSTADGEIWAFDPNPGASPLFDEGVTLRDFLELWITEGVVQPFVAESPDSGELQGVRPEARRRALPDLGPGGFAPAIWR